MSLLRNVFRPTVATPSEFRRYVASVTLLAGVVALAADIANQLLFFTSWAECWRDWSITTVVVVVIAVPIARSVGRAHLELHDAKAEAERLGRTDPLTGLANRRAFYEAAARLQGGALALVIADIDRFKRINDSYGHAAGDEVIKAVGGLMQEELGALGAVARVGGEEFAFVSADIGADELRRRLVQFRQRVAQEGVTVDGRRISVTVSAGSAARPGADFNCLYAAADRALYFAKSSGRDRVVDFGEVEEGAPAELLRAG